MSWNDDDENTAYSISTAKYAGEDEDNVPDSWDIDSDEEKKTEVKKVEKQKPKLTNLQKKIIEKEKKELDLKKKLEAAEPAETEKEREAQAKDLEFEMFKDAFEVKSTESVSGIDDFQIKKKEDFEGLREKLKRKLLPLESKDGYVPFLENTFRDLVVSMDIENLKKLSQMFTVLANEKSKTIKTTTKKKKNAKGKLVKDRDGFLDFDQEVVYSDNDDYF